VLDAEDNFRGELVKEGLFAGVECRAEVRPVARVVQVNVLTLLVALALQLRPFVLQCIL